VQCPFCASSSNVTETRESPDGTRRRRVCSSCKRRFTTYERVGSPGLRVEKRDGALEPFDSEKLMHALERITAHRTTVRPEDLKRIVRDVEATLIDAGARTAPWSEIARLVLERLTAIDRVSADRLRVNYLDEDGRLRLEDVEASQEHPPQLGLPSVE
jgi:transcriptional repressor NrdR